MDRPHLWGNDHPTACVFCVAAVYGEKGQVALPQMMLLSLILWGVGELLWQVNVSQIMIISSILAFASMWLFICQTVVYVVYKGYEVLKQLHAKKLQRGDTT